MRKAEVNTFHNAQLSLESSLRINHQTVRILSPSLAFGRYMVSLARMKTLRVFGRVCGLMNVAYLCFVVVLWLSSWSCRGYMQQNVYPYQSCRSLTKRVALKFLLLTCGRVGKGPGSSAEAG